MSYVPTSRKVCHPCEEREDVLATQSITFYSRDFEADEEPKKNFTFRVPILLDEGHVLLEGRFTLECLPKKPSS